MRSNLTLFLLGGLLIFVGQAPAIDWLTAPADYTHAPPTAARVAQYTPIGPYYYYARPDYVKSGFRHNRSTFQFGGSADNLHIVEQWGQPVVPYEQWRFPFRPYGSPYQAWGPPYGGLGNANVYGGFNGGGYGGGGFNGGGYGGGGFGGGGNGGYNPPYGPYPPFTGGGGGFNGNFPAGGNGSGINAQPWADGYYPSYNSHDRSDYYRPYGQNGSGF